MGKGFFGMFPGVILACRRGFFGMWGFFGLLEGFFWHVGHFGEKQQFRGFFGMLFWMAGGWLEGGWLAGWQLAGWQLAGSWLAGWKVHE